MGLARMNMKLAWIMVLSLAALSNLTAGSPVAGIEARDERGDPRSPQFLKNEMEMAAREPNLIRVPRDTMQSSMVVDSVQPASAEVPWTKIGLGAGSMVLIMSGIMAFRYGIFG